MKFIAPWCMLYTLESEVVGAYFPSVKSIYLLYLIMLRLLMDNNGITAFYLIQSLHQPYQCSICNLVPLGHNVLKKHVKYWLTLNISTE